MGNVIVIGGNHHNTLGVIRSLGEKGLRADVVLVTTEKRPFVGYSKYIRSLLTISQDYDITSCLLANLKRDDGRSVVICCSDASSSEVDLHTEELTPYFILPGAGEQGRITHLMNKKVMSELAVECELDIPPSFYPNSHPANRNEISFPCIIKPIVSKDGSKEDICVCHHIDEVNEHLTHMGVGNVQIQQFIDKEFEYQLIGCSTGNEVIIPGVSRILRPCKGSNTSFLHYEPVDDNFCDMYRCREYVRRTGYSGLFSMEFLRDKQGHDYFMEMNFRNDGNAICVTEAGMNLPFIWYLSCTGQDYGDEMVKPVKASYVMPDCAELKLLLSGQINLMEYMGDLRKTDRFMEYDRQDPKPFWRMVRAKLHLW